MIQEMHSPDAIWRDIAQGDEHLPPCAVRCGRRRRTHIFIRCIINYDFVVVVVIIYRLLAFSWEVGRWNGAFYKAVDNRAKEPQNKHLV